MSFKTSFESGKRLEDEIERICRQHTRYVETNVLVPTLHTEHGYTEVDVLIAIGNVIITIESKNIAKLDGDVTEDILKFTSGNDASYKSLSPFTQNRIHQFSIIDEYAKEYKRWPTVIPATVLPTECEVSSNLRNEPSLTFLNELSPALASIAKTSVVPKYGAELFSLIHKWKEMNLRG